jgi:phosphoribosylformylglycinamidine synthase
MTTDCTPRYCAAAPRIGGAQAVAEAWRNLTATGATPLAVTDCLNFGSPENPHVMGQFVGCVEGIGEACRALDFPVVSGNVSFYNETSGSPIQPTPAIGGVGLIADLDRMASLALAGAGESLILIGDSHGHLGASLYAREIAGSEAGAPPPVDLAAERRNGDFLRALIEAGRVRVCHDVSDGGLAVALAEMALAGDRGASLVAPPEGLSDLGWLFGEDQARYVIAVPAAEAEAIMKEAKAAGVSAMIIGETGGDALTLAGSEPISLAALRDAHEGWLPAYMAAE